MDSEEEWKAENITIVIRVKRNSKIYIFAGKNVFVHHFYLCKKINSRFIFTTVLFVAKFTKIYITGLICFSDIEKCLLLCFKTIFISIS